MLPRGVAIAADSAENIVTVDGDDSPAGDMTLTKTSPNGVTLFSVRSDNTDPARHEVATRVDADSSGAAFVSDTIGSGYSTPVNADALRMRFDVAGRRLWRRVLGTDFDGGSTAKVLRDEADSAYALGLGPTPSGVRSRMHKVGPDVTRRWASRDADGPAPLPFRGGRRRRAGSAWCRPRRRGLHAPPCSRCGAASQRCPPAPA